MTRVTPDWLTRNLKTAVDRRRWVRRFQNRLDKHPFDATARANYAAVLTHLGHPLAPGYAATAEFGVVPMCFDDNPTGLAEWWAYIRKGWAAGTAEYFAATIAARGGPNCVLAAALPEEWAAAILATTKQPAWDPQHNAWVGHAASRAETELLAAAAWMRLAPKTRRTLRLVREAEKLT